MPKACDVGFSLESSFDLFYEIPRLELDLIPIRPNVSSIILVLGIDLLFTFNGIGPIV